MKTALVNCADLKSLPLKQRFWLRVNKNGPKCIPGRCWVWIGPTHHGYGKLMNNKKRILAHRYSYQLHHGPIPPDLQVLHSCDRPRCVNPSHLRVGTLAENMRDRSNRDRQARGSRNASAKLTERQAQHILDNCVLGSPRNGVPTFANRYKVHYCTILAIVKRTAWKHLRKSQ